VSATVRRVAAAAVALTLVALVGCDLWIPDFRAWWDRHSLTSSVASNLLVVGITALIIDEVVARRRRREHAVSVAVQGLIVFGQARRAYGAVTAAGGADLQTGVAADELRSLGGMVLTASPSLFEDPDARLFLAQVERFSVRMLRAASSATGGTIGTDEAHRLAAEMDRLQTTVAPLLDRIPPEERSLLEGAEQADSGS
jgi:hypothetical protein